MSHIKLGKSGAALRISSVAAARAVMTQDAKAGHREVHDVGTPRVRVAVRAPKVDAFLKNRKPSTMSAYSSLV